MSTEALVVSGLVEIARAGLAAVEASMRAASEAEAAEIRAMIGDTQARLAAIQPLAESLDAITEKHLARVREWRAERLAKQAAKDAIADRPMGCAVCGVAVALVGDPVPAPGTRCPRCADLPTEGLDPDDT